MRFRALKSRIAVVADDLTGACDTGIQFKKYGLDTLVLISPYFIRDLSESEVVVIDTESRNDHSEVAYGKVKEATRALRDADVELFYKKIDSTLRGNVGRELDAMLDVLDADAVIVAPAFPEYGRITVGGYHLVDGVPLGMMENIAMYEKEPRNSHIPTILQRQTKRKVGHITLFKVAAGLEALETEICSRIENGEKMIVVDAVAESDLKTIARVITFSKLNLIACGSAGLAKGIAEVLGVTTRKPVMIISGSTNSVTMRQLMRAVERPNSLLAEVHAGELLKSREEAEMEVRRVSDEIFKSLSSGIDVIVTSARSRLSVDRTLITGEQLGLEKVKIREAISKSLGEIVRRVLERAEVAGLVLTGGEVALRVCEAMGIKRLKLEREILPGIPLTTIVGGDHDGLKVVTKAGGFGGEEALVEIIQQLKGE